MLNVSIGEAVILVDGDFFISLKVFDLLSNNLIELAEIVVEIVDGHGNFALNSTFDLSNSAVDIALSISSFARELVLDGRISSRGSFVDQVLTEAHLRNSDDLSISLVGS